MADYALRSSALRADPQQFDHQGDSDKRNQPKHDRRGGTLELEWTQLNLDRPSRDPEDKHNE
jgi:hypothetical protein